MAIRRIVEIDDKGQIDKVAVPIEVVHVDSDMDRIGKETAVKRMNEADSVAFLTHHGPIILHKREPVK